MHPLHVLEISWCQVFTQHDRWQPCRVSLDVSVSNIHSTALIWRQGTLIWSVVWRSFLEVTDSKTLRKPRKLSHSCSVCKAQNSVLKVYSHRQHVVTNVWTFKVPMWKSRSLFCFVVTNVIVNKKFLNKQIFSMNIYFPIDLVAYKPLRNDNYQTRRFTFVYYFFQYISELQYLKVITHSLTVPIFVMLILIFT